MGKSSVDLLATMSDGDDVKKLAKSRIIGILIVAQDLPK
jgi:hypothetical protein